MRNSHISAVPRSLLAAALALFVVSLSVSAPVLAAGPFSKFKGTWSGGGVVKLDNGHSEKIRCRAYYTIKSAGSGLGMAIRCASAGNKFELRGRLNYAGGSVSGSWEERTFNASGSVAGRASSKSIKLRISGTLQGAVSISTTGAKQFVSISSSGPGLKSITISLRKRG